MLINFVKRQFNFSGDKNYQKRETYPCSGWAFSVLLTDRGGKKGPHP